MASTNWLREYGNHLKMKEWDWWIRLNITGIHWIVKRNGTEKMTMEEWEWY